MGEINLTIDKENNICVLKQRITTTKFSIAHHKSKAKKAQVELQKLEKELFELEGKNNG